MKENEIIEQLIKLQPGEIYTVSPRQYFLRGFEYYKAGRLTHLSWSDDFHVLNASVKGTKTYSVSLFIDDATLNYECNCPAWSPGSHCKHVICTLLGLKNVMDPACFNLGTQSEFYRNTLKASLLPDGRPVKEWPLEGEGASRYSICLEKKHYGGNFDILVQIAGVPSVPPLRHYYQFRLPRELQRLASEGGAFYVDKNKLFFKYLQKHGNVHPIIIKTDGQRIAVEWDPSLVFSSRTELNASDETLSVRRLCISDDGVCGKPFVLGNNFIADLERRRLGLLNDRSGWSAWNLLKESLNRSEFYRPEEYTSISGIDTALEIPIDRFSDIQFCIKGKNPDIGSMIFSIDNNAATPFHVENGYCMTIDAYNAEPGSMVLRACRDTGGLRAATTRLFFDFLPSVINGSKISGDSTVQKRKAVLVRAFMKLMASKKKVEAAGIIKDALSTPELNGSHGGHANRLLVQALTSFKTKSSRIYFHDGRWWLSENNLHEEALLYTIPFEVFGLDLFDRLIGHNEFVIPVEKLHRRLTELYSRLKEHGIPLFFKGRPVKVSKWDFSIDCTHGSAIEWLEIRPEIKCDGVTVDEAAWREAMDNNGVVEENDFVRVLDSNSKNVLEAIASLSGEHSGTKNRRPEIVSIPRMRMLDLMYLRKKGVKLSLSKDDEKLIERLDRFEKIEKKPVPDELNAKLRPYQREGYSWLSFLYEHCFGGCLADDMGLGKTLQTIALLAGIREGKVKPTGCAEGPHLLVLPPSLLFNWQGEISRFYPGIRMHLYAGKERTTSFEGSDVVLTTYGLVRRDIEKLKGIRFNVVIFDEAQAVKNIYADTTGAVRQLKGYFKLALTGTPIENHVGEYYSILDLCLPGLLGEYESFRSGIKADTPVTLEPLLRRTTPFVLRRTKEAVLKDLPPKTESDIYLDLTDKQKALYKKTVEAVRTTISKAYESKTEAKARLIALTAILKLRQLCVSPQLIDPGFTESSPKIEFLIGKLKELVEEGHSSLVFSQFTSFLDILEGDLRKNGLVFCRLDGSTPVRERKKLVEGFQNGMAPIFLLSLKAGGQGLNLTRASYVFHLDPWWNPAVESQASDRAHRIGQKNKVSITRILMRHTVEEKMMELKKKKVALYKAVMGDSVTCKRGVSISRSDFDYLLNATM